MGMTIGKNMKNIWKFIKLVPRYRRKVFAILIVSSIVGAINVLTPYTYKYLVDFVARFLNGKLDQATAIIYVAICLAAFVSMRFLGVFLAFIQERQSNYFWIEAVGGARKSVFDKLTQLSVDFYEKSRAGDLVDRFSAITQITLWLNSLTEGTLASIIYVVFAVVALGALEPLLGIGMTAAVIFNLYSSQKNMTVTLPFRRGWQRIGGRMAGLLAELVANIVTVRSFGGEAAIRAKYLGSHADWREERIKLYSAEWPSNLGRNVVNSAAVTASIVYVSYYAFFGQFTAGDILLALTLSQGIVNTIAPLTKQFNQAGDIEASAERLIEVIEADKTLSDSPNSIDIERIDSIEFKNVSFRYPGKDSNALSDVSFTLEAGNSLALVGPSGGGKSTIIKLMLRLYDPSEGVIKVNGIDLREISQSSIRKLMGVVLQDVALFNDTIRENIGFAKTKATFDEIIRAAVAAQADVFVRRLTDEYETLIGERGAKLSGGERQRVAIARAILKDPVLILLDEATSALDAESESLVQAGLANLMHGRTAIVVAHRLSTVMNSGQIIVISEGEIVEQGAHSDLVSAGGLYSRLLSLQSRQDFSGKLAVS